MKLLLLPLALCSLSVVLTSCGDPTPISPRPLGRYRYDPPDGPDNVYYGPSHYPGVVDANYDYPKYRTADKASPKLSGKKSTPDYKGGSADWYQSGVKDGKRDRSWGWYPEYRRHREAYDAHTAADYALGYNDGFSGRAN